MVRLFVASLSAFALACVCSESIAQATARKERVSLYLPYGGADGKTYILREVALVAYPERPCHLDEIPGYKRMRLATMSRMPVCYFKSGDKIIVVSQYIPPSEYPDQLFAIALVNEQDGTATVFHPGFTSESASERYIEAERARNIRSMPGAPLSPRDR